MDKIIKHFEDWNDKLWPTMQPLYEEMKSCQLGICPKKGDEDTERAVNAFKEVAGIYERNLVTIANLKKQRIYIEGKI